MVWTQLDSLDSEEEPTRAVGNTRVAPALAKPFSVFDMFSIGIGPSSSHTVGPMRAGFQFAQELCQVYESDETAPLTSLHVDLLGSLGATGRGHATDRAVVLGLAGFRPDTVPGDVVASFVDNVEESGILNLAGHLPVPFRISTDIRFLPEVIFPYHVNALTLTARHGGAVVLERTYYSVGGGFLMQEIGDPRLSPSVISLDDLPAPRLPEVSEILDAQSECGADIADITVNMSEGSVPYPYTTARELLTICHENNLRIWEVVEANELATRSRQDLDSYIARVWHVMQECITAGCEAEGYLPGWLQVRRRARRLYTELSSRPASNDSLAGMDWVNLYALAVNEENASGHRVVTAPTNGAAGVVPAVLMYWSEFMCERTSAVEDSFSLTKSCGKRGEPNHEFALTEGLRRFFLAATAIGGLIKQNASIAGAEVGCQGEVGSASAMAAAGLAETMGGTALQVENAAEIAMEHSLGLTCDPVGGLVQIPCIERNAIAAVKAINAARMALWGDGRHVVDLDTVVETMRQTGVDMLSKYKETSQGGLAVHIVEC